MHKMRLEAAFCPDPLELPDHLAAAKRKGTGRKIKNEGAVAAGRGRRRGHPPRAALCRGRHLEGQKYGLF